MRRHHIEHDTVTGPVYWASYLVNGDARGLEAEEKALADKWLAGLDGWAVVDVARNPRGEGLEPRFTWHYALYGGQCAGGEVIDYVVHRAAP